MPAKAGISGLCASQHETPAFWPIGQLFSVRRRYRCASQNRIALCRVAGAGLPHRDIAAPVHERAQAARQDAEVAFPDSGLLATVRGLNFDRVKNDRGKFGALLESFVFSER